MEPLHGSTNQRASLAVHDIPECRAKPSVPALPEGDEFADGTWSQKPVSDLTPFIYTMHHSRFQSYLFNSDVLSRG